MVEAQAALGGLHELGEVGGTGCPLLGCVGDGGSGLVVVRVPTTGAGDERDDDGDH